jgi:hypothetical protein
MARAMRPWTLLPIALLVGCVSLKPEAQPHSTVLLSVTLCSDPMPDLQQPTGLIVNVEATHGSTAKQFAFMLNSRPAGHYAFLVRLDLPSGPYKLSRLSATTADGEAIQQFDIATGLTFDARSKSTDYIGHIELRTGSDVQSAPNTSRFVIADAYPDELPSFVHAWPALRARAIGRRAMPGMTVYFGRSPGRATQQGVPPDANAAPVAAGLDLSSAAGLPPYAQQAFRYFLRKSYPRAFAVTDSGYYTGMATGGTDVMERALEDCIRAQPAEPKSRCRLFALDDTLLSGVDGPKSVRLTSRGSR